jgi:hypothetical protein
VTFHYLSGLDLKKTNSRTDRQDQMPGLVRQGLESIVPIKISRVFAFRVNQDRGDTYYSAVSIDVYTKEL